MAITQSPARKLGWAINQAAKSKSTTSIFCLLRAKCRDGHNNVTMQIEVYHEIDNTSIFRRTTTTSTKVVHLSTL